VSRSNRHLAKLRLRACQTTAEAKLRFFDEEPVSAHHIPYWFVMMHSPSSKVLLGMLMVLGLCLGCSSTGLPRILQ
jgi:hypothetical protein